MGTANRNVNVRKNVSGAKGGGYVGGGTSGIGGTYSNGVDPCRSAPSPAQRGAPMAPNSGKTKSSGGAPKYGNG